MTGGLKKGKGNGKNLGIRMGGEFHAGMVDRAVQGLSRQESLWRNNNY